MGNGRKGRQMIHDPAIFYDEKSGNYYTYSTGAVCQRSTDLVHWEEIGNVVAEPPKESVDWTGTKDIWAPDIVKAGKEYRLYCSNSSWGVRQSCIFLAVADSPEGPFVPKGCVLKTRETQPVSAANAIDANIITDAKTGEQYLLYGSFWGGCYVLKLDPATGFAAEEGLGVCVARRPKWQSGSIEGPYMVYQEETGYYYLFVSYGSLKSDYNIRVGRSRSICGPFVDFHGRGLVADEDVDNSTGLLLLCGYQWNEGPAYMAPGHNSILRDRDGQWYLVCHIRKKNFTQREEPSQMQVRRLYWSADGWPYVAAQPLAQTDVDGKKSAVETEQLYGFYERVTLAPALPQGITTSVPMKLAPEGYFESCSVQGTWELVGEDRAKITYGPYTEEVKISRGWDAQRACGTILLCGLRSDGVTFWAKRVEDLAN